MEDIQRGRGGRRAFSFDEYEPNPEGEPNEREIHAPISGLFDIEGSYKRLISREDVETIASLISIVVGKGKSPFMGKTNSRSHVIIFPR